MTSTLLKGPEGIAEQNLISEASKMSCGETKIVSTVSSGDPVKASPPVKQTVIRLKRRIEDSPSKILLLSFKKLKRETVEGDDVPTTSSGGAIDEDSANENVCSKVLRLVGTVAQDEADDNSIALTVSKVVGVEPSSTADKSRSSEGDCSIRKRLSVKAKSSKITEKARESFKKNVEENRFRIISDRRGISGELEGSEESDLLKLLDLVPESDIKVPRKKVKPEGFEDGNVTCNGKPMIKEILADEQGYVYDLYLSNDPCIDEYMNGHFVSVKEGDEELDFGEYREEQEEDFVDDDEDSNAEDNWRNDYPDSEEDGLREEDQYSYGATGEHSQDEDEMLNKFHSMHMKGDSSSDDDDNDGYGFSSRYSQYKRRVMQEYADEVVSVSSESDVE